MKRHRSTSRSRSTTIGIALATAAMVLIPLGAQHSLAAVRAKKTATITGLILPQDLNAHAAGINALGDVVGYSANDFAQPFIYYGHGPKKGTIAAIPIPVGFDDFYPSGINDTDEISASGYANDLGFYNPFAVKPNGSEWTFINLEPGKAKTGPTRPGASADSVRKTDGAIVDGMATGIADLGKISLWNTKTSFEGVSAQLALLHAGTSYQKYWQERPAGTVYYQANAVDEDSREGGYTSTEQIASIANTKPNGESAPAIIPTIWRTQGTAVLLGSLGSGDSEVMAMAEGRKAVTGKAIRRADDDGPGMEWVDGAGYANTFADQGLIRDAVYWYGQQTHLSGGNGTGSVAFNQPVILPTAANFSNAEAEGISPDADLIVGDVNNFRLDDDNADTIRSNPAAVLAAAKSNGSDGIVTTQDAYVWVKGKGTDLNTLISSNSGWHLTEAYGVNDNGEIVGDGTFNGINEGFLLKTSLK